MGAADPSSHFLTLALMPNSLLAFSHEAKICFAVLTEHAGLRAEEEKWPPPLTYQWGRFPFHPSELTRQLFQPDGQRLRCRGLDFGQALP